MVIFKIYLIGFFLINFLIYLIVKKSKTKANLLFDKISANYQIIKINKNIFYFKGCYITQDFLIFKSQKLRHFQNLNFIFNILRIAHKYNRSQLLKARIFLFFRFLWSAFCISEKFDKIANFERLNIKRFQRLFLIINSKARLKKEWLKTLYICNLTL